MGSHIMLTFLYWSIQYNYFLKNLHEKWSLVPRGQICFVVDHQHGLRDVTSNPALAGQGFRTEKISS